MPAAVAVVPTPAVVEGEFAKTGQGQRAESNDWHLCSPEAAHIVELDSDGSVSPFVPSSEEESGGESDRDGPASDDEAVVEEMLELPPDVVPALAPVQLAQELEFHEQRLHQQHQLPLQESGLEGPQEASPVEQWPQVQPEASVQGNTPPHVEQEEEGERDEASERLEGLVRALLPSESEEGICRSFSQLREALAEGAKLLRAERRRAREAHNALCIAHSREQELHFRVTEAEALLRSLCQGEQAQAAMDRTWAHLVRASTQWAEQFAGAVRQQQELLDAEVQRRVDMEAQCAAAQEERERLCMEAAEARILYQARGRQIQELQSKHEAHARAEQEVEDLRRALADERGCNERHVQASQSLQRQIHELQEANQQLQNSCSRALTKEAEEASYREWLEGHLQELEQSDVASVAADYEVQLRELRSAHAEEVEKLRLSLTKDGKRVENCTQTTGMPGSHLDDLDLARSTHEAGLLWAQALDCGGEGSLEASADENGSVDRSDDPLSGIIQGSNAPNTGLSTQTDPDSWPIRSALSAGEDEEGKQVAILDEAQVEICNLRNTNEQLMNEMQQMRLERERALCMKDEKMRVRELQHNDRYLAMQEHERQVAALEAQKLRVRLCSEAQAEKADMQEKHKEECTQLRATIKSLQEQLIEEQGQLSKTLSELQEARLETEVIQVAAEMENRVGYEQEIEEATKAHRDRTLQLLEEQGTALENAQSARIDSLWSQCNALEAGVNALQSCATVGEQRLSARIRSMEEAIDLPRVRPDDSQPQAHEYGQERCDVDGLEGKPRKPPSKAIVPLQKELPSESDKSAAWSDQVRDMEQAAEEKVHGIRNELVQDFELKEQQYVERIRLLDAENAKALKEVEVLSTALRAMKQIEQQLAGREEEQESIRQAQEHTNAMETMSPPRHRSRDVSVGATAVAGWRRGSVHAGPVKSADTNGFGPLEESPAAIIEASETLASACYGDVDTAGTQAIEPVAADGCDDLCLAIGSGGALQTTSTARDLSTERGTLPCTANDICGQHRTIVDANPQHATPEKAASGIASVPNTPTKGTNRARRPQESGPPLAAPTPLSQTPSPISRMAVKSANEPEDPGSLSSRSTDARLAKRGRKRMDTLMRSLPLSSTGAKRQLNLSTRDHAPISQSIAYVQANINFPSSAAGFTGGKPPGSRLAGSSPQREAKLEADDRERLQALRLSEFHKEWSRHQENLAKWQVIAAAEEEMQLLLARREQLARTATPNSCNRLSSSFGQPPSHNGEGGEGDVAYHRLSWDLEMA
eukprot:scaffold3735_cov367-Prasinococcus_capsulatus_cf.AAC.9